MRPIQLFALLAAVCLALALVSLLIGPGHIGLRQILTGLDDAQAVIVWQLRLPRTLLSLLAGACLAVSGSLMQTFFRNPLAEPYVTGISAGAALGAVSAQALGLHSAVPVAAGATAGGAVITSALYAFALRRRNTGNMSLILLGIALGTFCGSLVHLVLLQSGPGAMDSAMTWLLGHTSTVGYGEVAVLLPVALAAGTLAWRYVPDLDALLLGEEKAASLGVNIVAAKRGILGASAILATVCVAFCGVIAFVGLIVPHTMRSLTGSRHGRLLPLVALGGAAMTLGVDIVSRVVDPPREIPLTIITSLIGAPFFIGLLLRTREAQV